MCLLQLCFAGLLNLLRHRDCSADLHRFWLEALFVCHSFFTLLGIYNFIKVKVYLNHMAFWRCLLHLYLLSFSWCSFHFLRVDAFSKSRIWLETFKNNFLSFVLFDLVHKIKLTIFLPFFAFHWTFKLVSWWKVHRILLWRFLAHTSCHVCVPYWNICKRRTSACFGSLNSDFLIEGQYLSNLFFNILNTIFLVCDHLLLLLNSDHV